MFAYIKSCGIIDFNVMQFYDIRKWQLYFFVINIDKKPVIFHWFYNVKNNFNIINDVKDGY